MLRRIIGSSTFLFAVVFFLNFGLKLIHIGSASLWHDEALSAKNCFLEFGHIKHESEWDANPPFYYYCLWVWTKFFGISEISLRAMSALFSSLAGSLIAVYLQKKSGYIISVLFSLVFLLNPLAIFYAQEARCYSLEIFLTIINVLVLIRFHNHATKLNALWLGITFFLLFYTHYISAILIFIEIVFLLIMHHKRKSEVLIIGLVPLLLVIWRFTKKQWKVILRIDGSGDGSDNIALSNREILGYALDDLFAIKYLAFAALLLLCLALFKRFKLKENTDAFALLFVISGFLIVISYYTIGLFAHVFAVRYVLYTLPLFVLGIASLNCNKWIKYAFAVCTILVCIPKVQFAKPKGMDFRLAARITAEVKKQTDAQIILQTHDIVPVFTYYYSSELFENKDRAKKSQLEKYGIVQIDRIEQLSELTNLQKTYQLHIQSFVKEKELAKSGTYFNRFGFKKIFETSTDGVKLSLYKRI